MARCQECGRGGAHADGFCSDHCLIEWARSERLNKEAMMGKKKKKKESRGIRLEHWLSRETHKMLAEFCILVLAAATADHVLVALGHALVA